MTAVLESYRDKLTERTANHMGYPYNLDFDYGALAGLERFSINNLGDPFIESNYGVHSREFEVRRRKLLVVHAAHVLWLRQDDAHNFHCTAYRQNWVHTHSMLSHLPVADDGVQIGVLNWFAKLWEIESEDMWGYVTNCGTEGNLHGILTGRENLPDGASLRHIRQPARRLLHDRPLAAVAHQQLRHARHNSLAMLRRFVFGLMAVTDHHRDPVHLEGDPLQRHEGSPHVPHGCRGGASCLSPRAASQLQRAVWSDCRQVLHKYLIACFIDMNSH